MWVMWDKTRYMLLSDELKNLRQLKKKLFIRPTDRERWLNGPGMCIGGATKEHIDKAVRPFQAIGYGLTGGRERTFIGPFWSDVIVIPTMDLPGRIKGLVLYGREGNIPDDLTSKVLRYNHKDVLDPDVQNCFIRDCDLGIPLYPAVEFAKNTLYILNDILLAVQLHALNNIDHDKNLPLVAIYKDVKNATYPTSWRNIHKKKIFWGSPNSEIFKHAKFTNSKISTEGFSYTGAVKHLLQISWDEWQEKIEKTAKPWDEVLEKTLYELPFNKAEALLLNMGLTPVELEKLLKYCPQDIRECFDNFLYRPVSAKTIMFNRIAIREDDGWVEEKTGQIISNTILKIDRILKHPIESDLKYEGRLIYNEHSINFIEDYNIIRRDTFGWMNKKLIESKLGALICSQNWNDFALSLALMFKEPEIDIIPIIGWNEDKNSFVFSDFTINYCGLVEDKLYHFQSKKTPAKTIPKPAEFTSNEIKILTTCKNVRSLFALVISLLTHIISPVFKYPLSTVVCTGQHASETMQRFCHVTNCLSISCTEKNQIHNWPQLINYNTNTKKNIELILEHAGKMGFIYLPELIADFLSIIPGWTIIRINSPIKNLDLLALVPKIIINYLHDLIIRNFNLIINSNKTFFEYVLDDFAKWFCFITGNNRVIKSSRFLVQVDKTNNSKVIVNRFLSLVFSMYKKGLLEFERSVFPSSNKVANNIVYRKKENSEYGDICIPKSKIIQILEKHGISNFDTIIIDKAFKETGLGDVRLFGKKVIYWVVSEELWNTVIEKIEKRESI